MAHVCIQRFGAGDRQNHGGQGEERGVEVTGHEVQRVGRRQRPQDLRVLDDSARTADSDDDEPRDHHRAEEAADRRGPVPLHEEQPGDDDRGDRHDEFAQLGVDDLEPFDRRED